MAKTQPQTDAAGGIPCIPPGAELTREVLEQQEARFREVLDQILAAARKHEATLRVIGSLAFRIQCPDYKYMEYDNQRYLTDVDFVAYGKQIDRVQDLFLELGWSENQNVLRLFGHQRRIFYHPSEAIHSDVFIDKLRFCHDIDFRGRLEIEQVTISRIDLLLEKLQIVEINRKDLIDVMVLLSQHPISAEGEQPGHIDGTYLARLCGRDWGWWRTATMNLEKTAHFAGEYLQGQDAERVREKIHALTDLIARQPRSLGWKLRALIGERVRWYREVEEVDRG
ncbi:MAG: hypothetical protein GF330_13170 [Candidatus Eisenbacteria bacterium]|nr:hypothetical protein [Candidatus Eisenbacteria bacterium]